jgi:molecular chaperone DnaK (HSP70)
VGYDALPYLRSRPQSTVYNAKRFIGRRVGEPETDTYAASHPFSVIPIGPDVSNHSAAGFDVIPGGRGLQVPSAVVPPEAVGADVLRHLLDVTAKFLGHDRVCFKVPIHYRLPSIYSRIQRLICRK